MGLNKIIRKSLLFCILIFSIFLFFVGTSFPKTDAPGVSTTPHDLTPSKLVGSNWIYDTTEVCVLCHTPHSTISQTPLWNKSIRTVTYSMYTTSTFNMGVGLEPVRAIGATSALCMSCHDGIMAMNVVLNAPGSGTRGGVFEPIPLNAFTKLGELYINNGPLWGPNISGNDPDNNPNVNNLRDEHPISFTYNPAADTEENNFPADNNGVITGTTGTKYKLYGSGKDQFECSTCHDVHDTVYNYSKQIIPGDTGEVFFLRVSNANSQMCRDCHQNK